MSFKRVLGLDLGTNSIGWALIQQNFQNKQGQILGMGSRIIPMSQDILGDFGKGNSISQTAERTGYRGTRRLRERHLLRRERLHRVLNVLGFLPKHYAAEIDFEKRLGQFLAETEPKLAWKKSAESQFEFLFQQSFDEMVADFKANGLDIKIPYDWTIYYLRKKALSQKLEKEELAWIILNFNQKRGYYQLRGEEEEENPNKKIEFHSLRIVDVVADEEPNKKGEIWYSLHLENGWIYRRSSKIPLDDWKDKVRDFIVTTDLNEDGSEKLDKDGEVKRSFRAPKEDDWTLIKKKTEQEIDKSHKTVGTYIYESLLANPTQKIRGKLVRTVERKFYKSELKQILEKQIELQPELFTDDLYNACVRELYRSNEAHQQQLSKRNFVHLFLNDIIFYQRPLRSQKSTISNCTLEFKKRKVHKLDEKGNKLKNESGKYLFEKDDSGEDIVIKEYLKAIPKSNPYYQEFRVWQWLYNLKIHAQDDDTDVTEQFIKDTADVENLFEFLMSQKEVNHTDILTYFIEPIVKMKYPNAKGKAFKDELKKEIGKYRWNYVYDAEKDESKTYPMNETGFELRKRLAKVVNVPADFLTRETEQHLWHIIYSVTDKIEFEKALKSFAQKYNLDEQSFVENFKRFKPFESDYGSFSEKAIKKLLPLLRIGKYWSWDAIDDKTKNRIGKIITGEFDVEIKNRVREKAISLTEENHFQGLQLWLAQYIVYDRHSEANISGKWNSVSDLEQYLADFKQHSLRNPIVEQIITETLRVVRDIWNHYGKGAKDYFDEIHIELGREMKNTAEERKRLSSIISENETTNLRIKAILEELMNDDTVENVRPYSPMQQEALKVYEDGVLNSNIIIPEEIEKISKKSEPTKSEIQRYKLWLEQKYRSPYTGRPIPLSKLFTPAYQIEHIIPQARFFDDSFSNKVICESEVNDLKDKQLGLEFIQNHYGQKVPTSFGEVTIFTEEAYKAFVKEHYDKNRSKRNKLLMEEIPEKMIERQMNDTRYISKYVSQLLSNIVRVDEGKAKNILSNAESLAANETDIEKANKIRERAKTEANDDGVNSKNVVPGNGKITGILKQDWGLNDVWNDLILPRFERMNQLTNSNDFTSWNEKHQKFLPTVPLELSKGFQKKRIDHRHHALDALIIACATRDHVNLLNNKHAKSKNERYDLQHKLRHTEPWQDKEGNARTKFTEFKKPWKTFTEDTRNELEKIVVSFKQNLRVINKATNHYEKIVDGKKVKIKQEGVNWAIRKSMHTPMPYGKKIYDFEILPIADNFGRIDLVVEYKSKLKQILSKYRTVTEAKKETKNKTKVYLKHYDTYQKVVNDIGKLNLKKELDSERFYNLNTQKKELEGILNGFDDYLIIDDEFNLIQRVVFKIKSEKYRKRQPLTELANRGKGGINTKGDALKFIDKITDFKIRQDLLDHFKEYNFELESAFSNEGIEKFNSKRKTPVYKIPIAESGSGRFAIGNTIGTRHKWVEADKGTNLFFGVYEDKQGKRSFDTIPLNIVIERQKQGLSSVPETNEKGHRLLFSLSPNDLVYVPNEGEVFDESKIDMDRIYKVVSFTSGRLYVVPQTVSTVIVNKVEYTQLNKIEFTTEKEKIIKLKVDRLGFLVSKPYLIEKLFKKQTQ